VHDSGSVLAEEFVLEQWTPREDTSSAILQLIAEYSNDVIALVRADMTFSYISPSAFRLFGRPISEVIDHSVTEFVFADDLPVIAEATRQILTGALDDSTLTVRVVKGDGSLLWVEVASRLVGKDKAGEPGDRAVIMRDVSSRKGLEDELRAMAMRDGLTGLANRRAFDEALVSEWKRTVRDKSQMSLLLLDIDRFKTFNDATGIRLAMTVSAASVLL
jgi:PAS domain S-box-containing protein